MDTASSLPYYRQLYEQVRQAVLTGQLAPGVRLPSTRTLAKELSLSRSTIVNAFEQLLAEGYLEGVIGAGTYVARTLPEAYFHARPLSSPPPSAPGTLSPFPPQDTSTSPLFAWLTAVRGQGISRAFRPGSPALDAFPFKVWSRLVSRRWRQIPQDLLRLGETTGYQPLRQAIAEHLSAVRGVQCEAEQVLIVSGSQQGIDVTLRMLLQPGEQVWMEEPGYPGAREALLAAKAQIIPVPVDGQGLDVAAGIKRASQARLAYVTPSHHFPLGVTMSLARRLALLDWAARSGAWILENDYDSEFRYTGRPLAALQGLDREGRVIYIGTFSKVLFPSLRLGYVVVPATLLDRFLAGRACAGLSSSLLDQAVLTDFLTEGHFTRHMRRMRELYAERQALLLQEAARDLAGMLTLSPEETGMQLVGWLPSGSHDQRASQVVSTYQVIAPPLSLCHIQSPTRAGFLLGYAGVREVDIRKGVQRLAQALRTISVGKK
ncbi:MAG: PLP-dependent aminotransferase family protein [Ktedonobacteraceae bacterium]|nr:PLP-dependent aminotransferase family protein [Ktedonobacteraceae bacterium]